MACDWLCMHPLENPEMMVPNTDMNKCKTTISMSETTLEIEKLKATCMLTDKKCAKL